jgi:hypothetical protein
MDYKVPLIGEMKLIAVVRGWATTTVTFPTTASPEKTWAQLLGEFESLGGSLGGRAEPNGHDVANGVVIHFLSNLDVSTERRGSYGLACDANGDSRSRSLVKRREQGIATATVPSEVRVLGCVHARRSASTSLRAWVRLNRRKCLPRPAAMEMEQTGREPKRETHVITAHCPFDFGFVLGRSLALIDSGFQISRAFDILKP